MLVIYKQKPVKIISQGLKTANSEINYSIPSSHLADKRIAKRSARLT